MQAVAPAPSAVTPSDFQLKPAPPRDPALRCPEPRPGEILVCGRRGQGQRLQALPPPPGARPGQTVGIDVAGGRLGPRVSEVTFPNGQVSKRITLDFTLPF
jgi:hypothetical protein